MSTLIDSYSESNQSASLTVTPGGYAGNSFYNTSSGTLDSCKFYLNASGATGNCYAKIYAHTGTYGTNGKPTGAALATSDAVNKASLPGSYGLVTFTFSGAERITLSATTYYVVQFYNNAGSSGNVSLGADNSSSTHGGNLSYSSDDGATWSTALASWDACFYVYSQGATLPSILSSVQDCLNTKAGTTGLTIQQAINSLAGTTNLTTQEAWNVYAGTTGLSKQLCANAKVGTTGLTYQEACNLL